MEEQHYKEELPISAYVIILGALTSFIIYF